MLLPFCPVNCTTIHCFSQVIYPEFYYLINDVSTEVQRYQLGESGIFAPQ